MRKAGVICGIVLMVLGVGVSMYSLVQLLQTGTCATGGPYEIAKPCPAGTDTFGILLTVGLFGAVGGLIAALWGNSGGAERT